MVLEEAVEMKKKLIWIFIFACAIILILCIRNRIPKKDTNLEFWIAENVDNVDFSNYHEKYGLMGGREYYGTGYVPTTNENGEQIDPEACVIYTVTSYPDYISNRRHVTGIFITDPSVTVYGLTINSSVDEVENVMRSHGFKNSSGQGRIYTKGKVSIRFSKEAIHINVKVRNLFKVQF